MPRGKEEIAFGMRRDDSRNFLGRRGEHHGADGLAGIEPPLAQLPAEFGAAGG